MTARVVLVDVSMPQSQQAVNDRVICKMPSDAWLKQVASDVKKMTPTQVPAE